MSKQVITITRRRVRKHGKGTGYRKCNMCNGTGVIKEKKK